MKSTVILEYVTRRESGKTASSEGPILFFWSWEKLKDQLMLLLYLTKNTCEFFEIGNYLLQTKFIKGKRTVIQVIQSSGTVLGFCRSVSQWLQIPNAREGRKEKA